MLLHISFLLIISCLFLFFKLYHPKTNQFNFFQVDRELSRFYQFGTYFVSDAKHWHHAFDFLQKTIGSQKL